jgi:hypothetical protein
MSRRFISIVLHKSDVGLRAHHTDVRNYFQPPDAAKYIADEFFEAAYNPSRKRIDEDGKVVRWGRDRLEPSASFCDHAHP